MANITLSGVLSFVIGNIEQQITLAFCGHLADSNVLPVMGLAISMSNIIILSPQLGFNTCMDYFMSQAIGRAETKAVVEYFNKARLYNTLQFVFLQMILINLTQVLAFFHQDADTLNNLDKVMWLLGIAFQFQATFDLYRAYFINMSQSYIPQIINSISVCFHFLVCQILIYYFDLGSAGAASTFIITEGINVLLSQIYISLYIKNFDINFLKFKQLTDFDVLYQGICGIIQLANIWWSFEFITIFVGSMGLIELGTQSIFFQLQVLMFMIPLGIGKASAQYVGGCISSGCIKSAKTQSIQSIILWIFIIFPVIFLIQYDPQIYSRILSNNIEIQQLFQKAYREILFLLFIFDTLQGVLAGIARGVGLQDKLTWICLIQWLQGVPIVQTVVQIWELDFVQVYKQFCLSSLFHCLGIIQYLVISDWDDFYLASKELIDKDIQYEKLINETNSENLALEIDNK